MAYFGGLNGNSGTNSTTNFLGTTDNQDLILKRNGVQAGLLNELSSNTSFGVRALNVSSSGVNNTAIGYRAMPFNTTGYNNTSSGKDAMYNNTSGHSNVSFGGRALYTNSTGQLNVAVGYDALYNTTGNNNTAIGHNSGGANTTGSNNIFIGWNANPTAGTFTNAVAIGLNALVGQSNALILGGMGANAVNVGIGTTTPSSRLHVVGFTFVDGKCTAERAGDGNPMFEARKTDAGIGSMMTFVTNGSTTGEIRTTGVATTYNTTSDIRLKENIKLSSKGINDVMKIAVKDYNYKADETKKTETGFIAQELYEIYPQAVHKGGEDIKTNPWMVDYSKLTPLLVKGMQEQQQLIEKLNTQNEALLKRIEALEKK